MYDMKKHVKFDIWRETSKKHLFCCYFLYIYILNNYTCYSFLVKNWLLPGVGEILSLLG